MNAPVKDRETAMMIEITDFCQRLHVLPRSGGLLDQDSYLIWGIGLVMSAREQRRQLEEQQEERKAKRKGGK